MSRWLVVAALLLTACGDPLPPVKPEPMPVACPAVCFTPCDVDWPEWVPTDPDAPEAWDERTEQVDIPAKAKLDRCEGLHRTACVQCLRRAEASGAIRLEAVTR